MLKYQDSKSCFNNFLHKRVIIIIFALYNIIRSTYRYKKNSIVFVFLMHTLIFTKEIFVFIKIISTFACISCSLMKRVI